MPNNSLNLDDFISAQRGSGRRPDNYNIALGETCGIEMEFDNLNENIQAPDNWRKTHDASIQTDVLFTSLGISLDRNIPPEVSRIVNFSTGTSGVEIVSPILDTSSEDLIDQIKDMTNMALRNGENLQSERSGIHFHISLPFPTLTTLKAILRLGKHFESLFFTLGGMGYSFRGIKNDSVYCRPITRSGPPCVNYRGNYAQSFFVEDLLKTKTREEFWYLYGDCPNHTDRYNPVRYTWLNLYPMNPYGQYRGTLEFRIFNKSLNPLFVYSNLILCKKFVELVLRSSYSSMKELNLMDEMSVYDSSITKEDLFRQLLKFHELVEFDPPVLNSLMKILELTPITKLEEKYIFTHLRNRLPDYWSNYNYSPKLIQSDLVHKPKFVDIHVLRGE